MKDTRIRYFSDRLTVRTNDELTIQSGKIFHEDTSKCDQETTNGDLVSQKMKSNLKQLKFFW